MQNEIQFFPNFVFFNTNLMLRLAEIIKEQTRYANDESLKDIVNDKDHLCY